MLFTHPALEHNQLPHLVALVLRCKGVSKGDPGGRKRALQGSGLQAVQGSTAYVASTEGWAELGGAQTSAPGRWPAGSLGGARQATGLRQHACNGFTVSIMRPQQQWLALPK